MPISLAATYSDMPGFTCAAATASLTQNGRTLYSEPADINGSAITASLDVAEFLPTNGQSYTVVLDVRSSSSLYGSANATFLVDFTEPAAGELQITNDGETGYVSLTALFDNHASDVEYDGTAGTGVTVQSAAVRSLAVDGMSVQDGTPTPDNPIPIQVVEGANLIPYPYVFQDRTESGVTFTTNADGSLTMTGTATANISSNVYLATNIPLKGTYTLSVGRNDMPSGFSLRGLGAPNVTTSPVTYTLNGTYSVYFVILAGTVLNHTIYPMLNAGTTAQPYVPYGALGLAVTANGQTTVTPIDLQGNVLASLPDGTHDVLNVDSAGHVTITKNMDAVDLGSLTWSRNSQYNVMYATVPGKAGGRTNILCSYYKAVNKEYTTMLDGEMAGTPTSAYINIKNDAYTDTASFKTAMAGVLLYFKLTAPTTIDLGYIDLPALADGATVDVVASLATSFELVGYDGSADAASISVLRVNLDGSTTQLLDGGESGAALVDMYAPLNAPYKYAVVTRAASQAVKTVYFDNELASVHWFAYWSGKVARATWNPSGQTSITRPEKKRVHYVGREYPVSYDTLAIDQQNSMSWTLLPADEADGFRELMCDGGRGVYKGCDGQVFHADFEYTSSADFWHITRNEQVSLTITRIDGEQL